MQWRIPSFLKECVTMRLPAHQTRVLQWFSDPTRSRKAEVIAAELGLAVKTVRMARSTLTALGLLETTVQPTAAGKELLSQ